MEKGALTLYRDHPLAFIIAHEMTHSLKGHGRTKGSLINRDHAMRTCRDIDTHLRAHFRMFRGLHGLSFGRKIWTTFNIAAASVRRRFYEVSRECEVEADKGAMAMIWRAGYSPWGCVEWAEVAIERDQRRGIDINKSLPTSTHPTVSTYTDPLNETCISNRHIPHSFRKESRILITGLRSQIKLGGRGLRKHGSKYRARRLQGNRSVKMSNHLEVSSASAACPRAASG
jgi:hypothetical protein